MLRVFLRGPPVGKATMKEGQQISVEEYYSMVLLEGAYCFICQKEKKMSKSTFIRRDARLLPH